MKNKLLQILSAEYRIKIVSLIVVLIVSAILDTIGLASIMPFLIFLRDSGEVETNLILLKLLRFYQLLGFTEDSKFIYFLGSLTGLIILISTSYRVFSAVKTNQFIESIRHELSYRLFSAYLYQDFSFFLQRKSTELSKNILSEVDIIVDRVFRPLLNLVVYGLVGFVMISFLFISNPLLTICFSAVIFLFYYLFFFRTKNRATDLGRIVAESNIQRFKFVSEALANVKIIKLYKVENVFLKHYTKPSSFFSKAHAKKQIFDQTPNFLVEAIIVFLMITLTLFLIPSNQIGVKSSNSFNEIVPTLVLFMIAFYRLKPAMQQVYTGVISLKFGSQIIDRIAIELNNNPNNATLAKNSKFSFFKIQLKQVFFKYPGSDKYVFKNLNLEFSKGDIIGVIGESGSGKTTFIDIFMGILTPQSGQILFDGKDLKSRDSFNYHSLFGYVPQDVTLLDASIAENIAFGLSIDKIDFEKVTECAKIAQIDTFILSELSAGYDTLVGEGGLRLSGGQKQRIGIARALYRNAQVLILDEATSALDPSTERAFLKSLFSMIGEKTVVMVTHRLSSLKMCNKTITFNGNNVSIEDTSPF